MRRPDRTLATLDHATPTLPRGADGRLAYASADAEAQVKALIANCRACGIELLDLDDPRRGIVHVIGPELGATQPGMTIVCGDSHTSTHGAFGALAFGIGTTEVGHVLATQCLLQRKPKSMRISFSGRTSPGVSAKDMALAMIAAIGADGGQGFRAQVDAVQPREPVYAPVAHVVPVVGVLRPRVAEPCYQPAFRHGASLAERRRKLSCYSVAGWKSANAFDTSSSARGMPPYSTR